MLNTAASRSAPRSLRGTATQTGSSSNLPRRHGGMASESIEKSFTSRSHRRTPAVCTMIRLSNDWCSIHQPTSRSTHQDWAASGEAMRINHLDRLNPYSMRDQSLVPAAMLVLSTKTFITGGRYHLLASFSIPFCSFEMSSRSAGPL